MLTKLILILNLSIFEEKTVKNPTMLTRPILICFLLGYWSWCCFIFLILVYTLLYFLNTFLILFGGMRLVKNILSSMDL